MPKLAAVVAIVLACGCAPSSTASQVEVSPAADAAAGACRALAAASCDRAPLDCAATQRWLDGAVPEPHACASAQTELEQAAETLGDPGLVAHATLQVLAEVAGTPVAPDALAWREEIPFVSLAAEGARSVARCPGTSRVVGEPGVPAAEAFCARPGGMRHGPAVRWDSAGIAIHVVTYRDGRVVDVAYHAPVSIAAFLCPDGSAKHEVADEDHRVLSCRTPEGRRVGAALTFHDDVSVAVDLGGADR